jgi:hypothetical protein
MDQWNRLVKPDRQTHTPHIYIKLYDKGRITTQWKNKGGYSTHSIHKSEFQVG